MTDIELVNLLLMVQSKYVTTASTLNAARKYIESLPTVSESIIEWAKQKDVRAIAKQTEIIDVKVAKFVAGNCCSTKFGVLAVSLD